jgi:hypothetical protein
MENEITGSQWAFGLTKEIIQGETHRGVSHSEVYESTSRRKYTFTGNQE